MKTADFDFDLPSRLIAQHPLPTRTDSRLLVLHRDSGKIEHGCFSDLTGYLKSGDCLVLNDTKVRPARLSGRKTTGAAVEILLLKEKSKDTWEALRRPAKRLPVGAKIVFNDKLSARIIAVEEAGKCLLRFFFDGSLSEELRKAGCVALPPYIHAKLEDDSRYQTVFANKPGSAAAPTAGLHFTESLLGDIREFGVELVKLTLDIGLDTFRPIQVENLKDHRMHSESYDISPRAAQKINTAKAAGATVISVGTTTLRALEAAGERGSIEPGKRSTDLFITPGFKFKYVDMLLTNFHLPKSTLLVLVSAFAGAENIRRAYAAAVAEKYRFYSFGDAMLII